MRAHTDAEVAVDAGAIAGVGLAIVTVGDHLALMSALVPLVVLARFLIWSRVRSERAGPFFECQGDWSLRAELLFFGVCTVLGGTNDWLSVHVHRIYAYDVPAAFPTLSSIPLWMLLYWGLILRFVATLAHWYRMHDGPRNDAIALAGHAPLLRVSFLLALVFVTRRRIYVDFDDPIRSWIPFALALVVYALVARPTKSDLKLAALFLVGGPLVESAFIQLGGLHRYAHGVLGGVPIWIALWWVLAVLIWKDLSHRLQALTVRLQAFTPKSRSIAEV